MNLSDLQLKEVIDISSGRRVGSIIDVVIHVNGEIDSLVLEDRKAKHLFSNTHEEVNLDWKQIIKIGDDIILVDLNKNR